MTTPRKLTGAEIVCESLLAYGVHRTIFGYPGGAVIPLYDAMGRYQQRGELHHTLVRHEQAAAFAANAMGRISRRAGVCIATSGPGATNLITGVVDAMLDNAPLVVITGQVFSHLVGSDAFQETDSVGVMMPITKHSTFIDKAEDIERAICEAFYIAEHGRPGPVHVDITKDAFLNTATFDGALTPDLSGFKPTIKGSLHQIRKAAELIAAAKQPVVLIGQGALISQAEAEVAQFVEMANLPAVATLHGLSALPADHPNFIAMLGMHGSVTANYTTHNADLIISLGSRFDDRITGRLDDFAPNAKIIHIDIDPAELNKNVHTFLPICGDIKTVLTDLLPLLKNIDAHADWWQQIHDWQAEYPIDRGQKAQQHDHPLTVPQVITALGEATGGNAFVVPDVGQHQMFVAQYYPFKIPRSAVSSGGLGSMGAGLPLALGVQTLHPDAEVWSVSGDGGFQMNCPELATVMQEKLPIKIAVINNGYLGMVRQWQELYHDKHYSNTPMLSPDFVKLAAAYDIPAFRATTPAEAVEAIAAARAIDGPAFVEFVVAAEENVFPMVDAGASLKDVRVGDE